MCTHLPQARTASPRTDGGPCSTVLHRKLVQAPVLEVTRGNGGRGHITSLCLLELFISGKINNSLSILHLFYSYNNLILGWQTCSFHFSHDLNTSSSCLFQLVALCLKTAEDWMSWAKCGCCGNTVHGCFTRRGKNVDWRYGWQLQSGDNMIFLFSN